MKPLVFNQNGLVVTGSTCEEIKVRACQIECIDHPEWGTFGVLEDRGGHYEINGRAGRAILDKSEANRFWAVVK